MTVIGYAIRTSRTIRTVTMGVRITDTIKQVSVMSVGDQQGSGWWEWDGVGSKKRGEGRGQLLTGPARLVHPGIHKTAEDSDDSLLEELATVAVKEGSDSDENLSDVEDLHKEAEGGGSLHQPNSPPMKQTEEEEEEEEEAAESPPSDLAVEAAAASVLQQVYEHNPGEVYPIAEEEEEAASPTAPDGVTSLRRRARLNSGSRAMDYTMTQNHTKQKLNNIKQK